MLGAFGLSGGGSEQEGRRKSKEEQPRASLAQSFIACHGLLSRFEDGAVRGEGGLVRVDVGAAQLAVVVAGHGAVGAPGPPVCMNGATTWGLGVFNSYHDTLEGAVLESSYFQDRP